MKVGENELDNLVPKPDMDLMSCAWTYPECRTRGYQLKILKKSELCTAHEISEKTLKDLLNGKLKCRYDRIRLIDCRFKFEVEGGTIVNAESLLTTDDMLRILTDSIGKSVCLIFFCEYSQSRSVFWSYTARTIVERRYAGMERVEVYLLSQGYRNFWNTYNRHGQLFTTGKYISMFDPDFEQEKSLGLRKHMSERKKIPDLTQYNKLETLKIAIECPMSRSQSVRKLKSPALPYLRQPASSQPMFLL